MWIYYDDGRLRGIVQILFLIDLDFSICIPCAVRWRSCLLAYISLLTSLESLQSQRRKWIYTANKRIIYTANKIIIAYHVLKCCSLDSPQVCSGEKLPAAKEPCVVSCQLNSKKCIRCIYWHVFPTCTHCGVYIFKHFDILWQNSRVPLVFNSVSSVPSVLIVYCFKIVTGTNWCMSSED